MYFSRAFVIYCDLSDMFVIQQHAPSDKKKLRLGDGEERKRKEKKKIFKKSNMRVVLK